MAFSAKRMMSEKKHSVGMEKMTFAIGGKIVVTGGGAAGMMSAICAAEQGASVTLLEPNERLGKKLNITGKGRCNLTNNAGLQDILSRIPHNGRFLYGALSRFSPQDTMAFFERLGVRLKTERGGRVFPVSDRAFDISAALERRLKQLGVQMIRDRAVSVETVRAAHTDMMNGETVSMNRETVSAATGRTGQGADEEKVFVTGVTGEQGYYPAQAVILATGGISYPATGSTGEGHRMARELGHSVTELNASLVPLCEKGNFCAKMQGLSLRNVGLTVRENDKKIREDFGELVFTHFGVSGPLVLTASAYMRHFGEKRYRLEIDLKPALDEPALDRRLLSDFGEYANREFQNALDDLLPRKMIPVIVERSGIPPETKVNTLTRAQRRALLQLLKCFPVEIAGTRPVTEAVVTAGGVNIREVNPSTMESRLVQGLYFAGEILDVDACTGGYNLQIAWSTGHLAGTAAAQRVTGGMP